MLHFAATNHVDLFCDGTGKDAERSLMCKEPCSDFGRVYIFFFGAKTFDFFYGYLCQSEPFRFDM
jgi:hypothetical protein